MAVLTAAKTIDLSSRRKLVFHFCLFIRNTYNICKGKETQVNPQVKIPAIGTHHDRHTYSTLVYQSEISKQCHLIIIIINRSHGTISPCKGSSPKCLTIMIKKKPIHAKLHLGRYHKRLLVFRFGQGDPFLHFGFAHETGNKF
jgi:hypothetical protein